MCRKLMFLISLVFVLGMMNIASGDDYTWTNDYPWSVLYISPWNWDPVAPYGGPGAGDTAFIAETEDPLVIDGDVAVRRIRGVEGSMTVLIINDANIVIGDNIRVEGEEESGDTLTFNVGDNARIDIGSDGDASFLNHGDHGRTIWNITDDAQITSECDWRFGDEDDDYFELNIDSGYLQIGNCDDGFRQNNGEFHIDISGDAVVECDDTRWRGRSDDFTNTLTVRDDAVFNILDGNLRGGGGSSNLVIDILDNAVVEMDGEVRMGEDNDFSAVCTINMDGQLLAMGDNFNMIDDDESTGFTQVNLISGLVDVSNGELRSDTDNWHMDIEAAVMILDGDVVGDIEDWVADSHIVPYHTRGDIATDYDVINLGKTTVWAIPNMRRAWNPSPALGETGLPSNGTVLSWNAGDFAVIHHIYFSDDEALVVSRDDLAYLGNTGVTSQTLGSLQLGTTYYWAIDEQDAETTITWGLLWSFTVEENHEVEGFEEYTTNPNYLFDSWIDGCGDANGMGGNGTGSCVDLAMDQTHGGSKSMIYVYNNTDSTGIDRDANYSEAVYTYSEAQDWSSSSEAALVLYVMGDRDNDSSSMWVILNGNVGAMATYGDNGDNPDDIKTEEWIDWNINLADFTAGGVDLSNVTSIAIGFGDKVGNVPGGMGVVHFDDIGLYPVRCVPKYTPDIRDLNADCVVDWKDIGIIADNWLTDLR